MNNSQFRKLVLDTPARKSNGEGTDANVRVNTQRDGETPSALGSRMRSSIPMTPRSVASGGSDFARQLSDQNTTTKPQRKFRSTIAPKGTKLPAAYIDRTQNRMSDEDDEKATRVKALEELLKLQQIDEPTFISLRDEIVGGDVRSTHLVKGLDYKLLERVRRGEDVLDSDSNDDAPSEVNPVDIDDELDQLEQQEVVVATKEKSTKRGEMAPPSLIPGRKRTRDSILAEMKAARQAAKEASQPSLGAKFKKFGEAKSTSRIETDKKGRQVLITTDEHGNKKRKVKMPQSDEAQNKSAELLMPDKDAKPLGMEVPEVLEAPEEEEDIDIFDVGDSYNPLAGLEEDDSGSDSNEPIPKDSRTEGTITTNQGSMAPPAQPKQPTVPRNYFGETKTEATESSNHTPISMESLMKLASISQVLTSPETEEQAAKEAKRRKMLLRDDRDDQDMDLGFGSSRFEDEADFEEKKDKLSEWGRADDDDTNEKGTSSKRKRGPKKRKGDVNSAADVMKVLERRKAANS